jgi:tRNA A37 threonylcarbamoyladenosine dehydratase
MSNQLDFWRQMTIISPSALDNYKVTVIGVGGIGSPTVIALAKMGISQITVYDYDFVESHNLPNQIYRISDLGKPKVEALKEVVADYAGIDIVAKMERFENQQLSGIVISGVDSMAARKTIWDKVRYNVSVPMYIEARMGAEVCRIHSVKPLDPTNVRWYESTLYSDDDALDLPCTERAIIYTVFMISGLIVRQVKNFVNNQDVLKEIIFDLVTMSLLTNE